MTDRDQERQGPAGRDPQASPDPLRLRARPQPVTRINRKIVIGGAALLLVVISLIVLLALTPPSLRVGDRQELFNVEYKPITDALSKLPASYDGVKPDKKSDAPGMEPPVIKPGVPLLVAPAPDLVDADRAEKARVARMAGQALESSVFFRLQLKPPPKETVKKELTADPLPKPAPVAPEGGLAELTALRAADRALALISSAPPSTRLTRRASSPSSRRAPRRRSTTSMGYRLPPPPIS
jgi:type IV secretory pathway VirB10-like protein